MTDVEDDNFVFQQDSTPARSACNTVLRFCEILSFQWGPVEAV